jgi:hypothetical protein
MAGRSKHKESAGNVNLQPSVYGLDLGRDVARRSQRKRRRRNRIVRSMSTVVILATIGGAGWFAYTSYVEHDNNEQIENDRRVAEVRRRQAGRTTDDIIDLLEDTPAWNGPGNPTFGVGSDDP